MKSACALCPSRLRNLFASLNTGQLEELEPNRVLRACGRGEQLYSVGQEPAGLYCVHDGMVKIYKLAADGQRFIVRLAAPGDLFGYTALLSGEPHTATAEAVEESHVCMLQKAYVLSLLQRDAGVGLRLIQMLSREVRQNEDRLASLAQKRVRERLAEIILLLRRTQGVTDPLGDVIPLRLRREDLAAIIGTTTESLVRELKTLDHEAIIRLEKHSIRILNLPELIEAANL